MENDDNQSLSMEDYFNLNCEKYIKQFLQIPQQNQHQSGNFMGEIDEFENLENPNFLGEIAQLSMEMPSNQFNATNCNSIVHELLEHQREIRNPFMNSEFCAQFDLNQPIEEEKGADNGEKGQDEFDFIHNNMNEDEIRVFEGENQGNQIVPEITEIQVTNAEDENPEETDHIQIDTSDVNIEGSLLGVKRKTFEEIYDLYLRHASVTGFSVRKHTTRHIVKTGEMIERYYVCSAEGKRNSGPKKTRMVEMIDEESTEQKRRKRRQVAITRTDCQACIRVKKNAEGDFVVIQHVVQHNHELTRKQLHYMHRAERQITAEKAEAIATMKDAGLTTMESYNYMCTEAGGQENLGHTVIDHMNFCSRLRMEKIEAGNAQTLLNKLNQEQSEDPEFFFRVKLDNESRISNIFWRDSMMLEDYNIYGDVVFFDTTYRTNRYNLICAPFVGINNHWKNTMFACAFIGDEKTESFVWLLETFKESMQNKTPTSIFTDQDQAITNAIEKVFPESRHRLCIWHLEQNAIQRFGALKKDHEFKDVFNKCLKGCVTEAEFEEKWKQMIVKFELTDHAWYKRIYALKEKWCPALSKDFFSAGILSSQRSESTNHAIGFNANKSTTLTEFYVIFQRTIIRWRSNEKSDEFQCSKSIAFTSLPLSGMLKHAAQVFTLSLFRDFEEEFGYSMATIVQFIGRNNEALIYDVSLEDRTWSRHRVNFIIESQTVWCTCKNFEASGWLCYHCIRVLHLHSVTKIPEKYVCKRWTKYAKSKVWDRMEEKDPTIPYTPWRQTMMRKFYNLILKSQANEQARAYMEESFRSSLKMVEKILTDAAAAAANTVTEEHAASNIQDMSDTTHSNEYTSSSANTASTTSVPAVLDPKRATTKGRSKRVKGGIEKQKRPKAKSIGNSEFGSKTPNIRLF